MYYNKVFELVVALASKEAYYQIVDLIEALAKKPLNQMNDIELNIVESVLHRIYLYLIGGDWSFAAVLQIVLDATELQEITANCNYIWN